MTYEELENGLKERGFTGIEGICNMGDCHKDNKHYILTTDGLVIYSNIPFWTNEEYYPDSLVEVWCMELNEWDTKTKEFSFEELDEIMNI